MRYDVMFFRKSFLISDLISYFKGPDLLGSGQYYIILEAGESMLIFKKPFTSHFVLKKSEYFNLLSVYSIQINKWQRNISFSLRYNNNYILYNLNSQKHAQ